MGKVNKQRRPAFCSRLSNWFKVGRSIQLDPLTDLPNRAAFEDELTSRLHRLAADGAEFAVAMIDLAKFKIVNDTYGHVAGDGLLTALAARFTALLQPGEFVARIGGDEFAALLPCSGDADLKKALARLRFAVDSPFSFDTFSVTCGAGIGVACAPGDGTVANQLLEQADLAMYRAKRADPAETCHFCPALDDAQRLRRDLGSHLRTAIDTGQLGLTFIPSHAVPDRSVLGYEAVPHWDHPTLGTISAQMLYALAEESAATLPLASWMLHEACTAAATWREAAQVAVNISPLLLADATLPDTVAQALDEAALPASRLCLELTEDALLYGRERALHRLHALRSLGVGIVLDEFGPAPCSLDLLQAFHFDRLKLHSSAFDANLADLEQPPPLLTGLAVFSGLFNIPVTALGADTPERVRLALIAGCDSVQGLAMGRLPDVPHRLPRTVPRPAPTLALVRHPENPVP